MGLIDLLFGKSDKERILDSLASQEIFSRSGIVDLLFGRNKKEYSLYCIASRIVTNQGRLFFENGKKTGSYRNNLASAIADMELCLENTINYFSSLKENAQKNVMSKDSLTFGTYMLDNLKFIKESGLDWFGDYSKYKEVYNSLKKINSKTSKEVICANIYLAECQIWYSEQNSQRILSTTRNLRNSIGNNNNSTPNEWLYCFFDEMKKSLFWRKDCKKFMEKIYGKEESDEGDNYALAR
ncbi:MAG: hypothetical protein KAT77_00435 [Nanoarchaeota archaeon]|nr:hypothetical protein [Nanoarchaeota archaeon]